MSQSVSAPKLTTGGQKALYYAGASVLALVVAAPIVAIAAGVVVNLAVIGGVGVLGLGLWMARPALALWWKNRVLKMLKAEARNNPIETLQSELLRRKERVKIAEQKLRQLDAQRMSLGDQLAAYKKEFREDDPGLREMYDKLSSLVDNLQAKLKNAQAQVTAFAGHVKKQAAKYKIAVSTGQLASALRQATGDDDPLQQFLHDEALDSVRDSFNQSMADINGLLMDEPAVLQINNDQSMQTIDLSPIEYSDLSPEMVAAKA